jgi:hypothetical protein
MAPARNKVANMSPEEKRAYMAPAWAAAREPSRAALKARLDAMSPEELKRHTASARAAITGLSPEEQAAFYKRRGAAIAAGKARRRAERQQQQQQQDAP